jgi:hypothetical protein
MKQTLLFLLVAALPLTGQEPIRQASEARLWLQIPAGQPPLGPVEISTGSASPASWEKDPAVRERLTDILFPIRWWAWNEVTISFTPPADGSVELTLNGPWAADENGSMPRQEILWDDFSAEGTQIHNRGFEEIEAGQPAGWKSPWSPYPAAGDWPLAGAQPRSGKQLASSWCKRPLSQTLEFKAGQKVRIRLNAKAATPPGFVAPKSLGKNTPAHRAAAAMKRGVNLGNGWEAPPPHSWGIKFTTEDIDHIAAEGFDHIRVPVGWHFHVTQGANWVGLQDLRGIIYPGPPTTPMQVPESLRENPGVVGFIDRYNTLDAAHNPSSPRVVRELLDAAKAWSLEFGRPVHLGEFGAHHVADHQSRSRYLKDVRALAEARGIPWTLWEWKAGFGYWDPENNVARFRASLFE